MRDKFNPDIKSILMTSDTLRGGMWTYVIELSRALGEYGIKVYLATMGGALAPEQREEIKHIPNLKVFESSYKLEWMRNPWGEVKKAGDWLLGLEKELNPDVAHLNYFAHGSLPWNKPVLIMGHACVISLLNAGGRKWRQAAANKLALLKRNRYKKEVKRGLQAADYFVAPTRAMLSEFARLYGPLPKAKVIPNGRNPELFAPAKKEPFIFTACRIWDSRKNVSALNRAAPSVNWPIYAAGEIKHPTRLLKIITGRFPNIRLLGFLYADELAYWFSRAAIFALPAYYEPFGLSTLEAGLCGCALVLGDIPTLREIWGDSAMYVNPDDPQELKCALNKMIGNDNLRGEFCEKARKRALQFTPGKMAGEYLGVYRELAFGH